MEETVDIVVSLHKANVIRLDQRIQDEAPGETRESFIQNLLVTELARPPVPRKAAFQAATYEVDVDDLTLVLPYLIRLIDSLKLQLAAFSIDSGANQDSYNRVFIKVQGLKRGLAEFENRLVLDRYILGYHMVEQEQ